MPGKGYRVDTDFKLRPDRRKKRAKAALVALAIMVLLEGYLFLHYLSWLGKTGEPPGIVAFMTSMGALFTFFPTVPLFSADTWRALGRMYLAGLPVMALILGFFLLSTKRLDPFRGVEYGSARWASGEERRAFSSPDHTIPVAEGLYVDPQNNDLKNLHELVVGDTGAGKSFRVVIPDMLQMTGSYVVADVKGTLYRQTRQVMEDNGYKVRVLNLKDLRYADEFHLFYSDNEDENSAGIFFERVFARCRKYGGLATGITQNVTNVMASQSALSMLQNCQFVVLLDQAGENLRQLISLYDLSDQQAAQITKAKKGEGLLIYNDLPIPFSNIYPRDNIVYDALTTDFRDNQAQLQKRRESANLTAVERFKDDNQ